MKNGRLLLAAVAAKHPRTIACTGLVLSVLIFCNGCMTQFHSTSFDVKPKPASAVSGTNFRVSTVSHNKHEQEFESALREELEKLELQQDSSLPAVPYDVALRYLGREETSEGMKLLTGLLFIGSCFVFPHWDNTTHKWKISTSLPGETVAFQGERSTTEVLGWFMLPFGIRDAFSSGGGRPSLWKSMAKAVFASLTQERYDKAVSKMRLQAKQQLLAGKRLSEAEERLLENDTSLETFVAMIKHPANKDRGLASLSRIDDPETLADIALHSSVPEIRQTAAQRVTGLSEPRFAELAAESADLDVAQTFLDHVSDDDLLHQVVQTRSARPKIKSAAVGKIRQESVLADIAAHAPEAGIRKIAIGKIDNPAILIVSVAKDADPGNRLAALERINHPKALAAILRKSGDAAVRAAAVGKLSDAAVIDEIAQSDASARVRCAAVTKTSNQALLARIARNDPALEVRLLAVQRLEDETILREIVLAEQELAVRNAAMQRLPESSRKTLLASLARTLLRKAEKARADGLIPFCGFYVGMPWGDANLLKEYYGLQEGECQFSIMSFNGAVTALKFSLGGIRRVTQGGNSFDELAVAVASRIGPMEPKSYVSLYVNRQPAETREYYEYKTIDGSRAVLSEHDGLDISGGEKLLDRIKKEQAVSLEEAVEKASKETPAVLGVGSSPGETKTLTLPGGAEMEMVWCPPGTFMMGSPENEEGRDDDETQHQVTLTEGFWMAKYEVTQKQWKNVMGNNPSRNKGDDLPVDNVSWYDCMEFCRKSGLRLPTEAEWEYACRAGSTGPYAGTGRLENMGWFADNSGREPHPVGKKQPNAWGLHDMHGNVSEWCADLASNGMGRSLRGGSWRHDAQGCRSAHRDFLDPSGSIIYSNVFGLRLCCSAGLP